MTTCPKCRYTRQPSDTAPDYECPKCGVVYAKAFSAAPTRSASAQEPEARRKPPLFIVGALLVIAGGGAGWMLSNKSPTPVAGMPVVVEKPDPAAAKKAEEEAFLKRQKEEQERQLLEKATKDLERLHSRWKDASTLASSTARIAMATPVASLQAIRRETVEMVVPACLDSSKEALLLGMDKEIEGYVVFMQDANLGKLLAQGYFTEANDAFGKFSFRMKDACPKG